MRFGAFLGGGHMLFCKPDFDASNRGCNLPVGAPGASASLPLIQPWCRDIMVGLTKLTK